MLKYGGGGKGILFIDGRYKQAVFKLTMKNFRLFETEAEHNEAVIEECSVSYVIESNKLYTTPENNGEITFKILVEFGYWENDEYIRTNDTLTLKAAKDMSWGEFIDSEYNTLNFKYKYDSVMFDYYYNEYATAYFLRYDNGDSIGFNHFIIPNYEYTSRVMEA